jgi:EpsI family protein
MRRTACGGPQSRASHNAVLKRKHLLILTVVLAAQGLVFYSASGGEKVPLAQPLAQFPLQVGGWGLHQEGVVEKEILDVLRADDLLNRVYRRADGVMASLFVAYFRSQRTGQTPHSPQNCLPGSGWVPSRIGFLDVEIPEESRSISINRYTVAKGDAKSVVLYWYQSRDRVVASEVAAKFWLVADSIRYHRSDTALVRVVVPVGPEGEQAASDAGADLVRTSFVRLRQFLPS